MVFLMFLFILGELIHDFVIFFTLQGWGLHCSVVDIVHWAKVTDFFFFFLVINYDSFLASSGTLCPLLYANFLRQSFVSHGWLLT